MVDADSGEPTRVSDLPQYNARPTAVGRSLSTPAAQPVTVPVDAVRGTMFGHSIHLPDINAPDSTLEELSSGSVQVIDSESGPQPVQPFPLAEPAIRAAMRAAQRVAATPAAAPAPVPIARSLFADVSADVRIDADAVRGDADDFELDTDVVAPRRRWPLIAAVVAGVGVLGGAAVLLLARGNGSQSMALPPPAATAPAPAPTVDPLPPVKTVEAPAQAPAAAEVQPPAEVAPAPEPPAPPPVRANIEVADEAAPKRKPAAKRSDTKVGPAAEAPPPPRPNRSKRRRIVREDPDATMAPTLD